ncbi:MAG TPA: prepilin peptidase [Caulobacterales bacterium]|jgi:prepilin peptidase CpaA|nr:prepilin peptidase [Caulobacterales bacterium]
MITLLALLSFAGLLLWAAAADIATMEIPNRISILAACLYPVAALALGDTWQAIAAHLATGAGALLLAYILFSIGVFGGGDAKMIAAAAIWTGPLVFMQFLFFTALAGGLLTVTVLATRGVLRPADSRPSFMNRLLQPAGGVPYAVAIAAGGMAVLLQLPLAQHLGT